MKEVILKYGSFLAIGLLTLNYLPLVPQLRGFTDPTFQGLFQLIIIASFLMYGINSFVSNVYKKEEASYAQSIVIGIGISFFCWSFIFSCVLSYSFLRRYQTIYIGRINGENVRYCNKRVNNCRSYFSYLS
jgi:hypothetical protein